ncbi:unnamed protein product [Parnassius mnemosyne]|uniref:Shavenoid isoform B-like N-terminal domain-containing protein n=1 Tax=Parnassius mnemosyne TaxID=213953 RepID=A0AAV1KR05_9NEOP
MALLLLVASAAAASLGELARRETGDVFTLVDGGDCGAAQCAEHGAREVPRAANRTECVCACPQRAPLFREDRELCVDDLPECSLATFGTGVGVQRIPFVYLPLKGQIIHPSREIIFQNVKTPICAVSGAQYLTRKGFLDLRNTLDADVPFSLFRDEGRTFLQWSGEDDMRTRMSGRVMLVRLLCRDVAEPPSSPLDLRGVFTPCVAFRVQGTPPRSVNNITEVQFAPNAQTSGASSTSGLTVTEYVIIGISSLILGLIYVASVFLYLHIRKRRKTASDKSSTRKTKVLKNKDGKIITERDIVRISNERIHTLPNVLGQDDGIIKKNPLLSRQYQDNKTGFPSDSGSNMSDSDDFVGSSRSEDNVCKKQTTSAIVHLHSYELRPQNDSDISHRDESGIERLPDEHVSIVETIDDREITRPVGTTRKKLYFNPAYFEPHLMAEPPPAALEFLTKIREVISIAKHKMAAKRFQPVLNEIPEEETYPSNGNSLDFYQGFGSQRSGSVVSLKRENSRKKSVNCVGCPGCQSDVKNDLKSYMKSDVVTCTSCLNNKGEKQNSIRKWLENIPNVKQQATYDDLINNSQNNLTDSVLSLPINVKQCALKKQNSFSTCSSVHSRDEFTNIPKRSSTRSVRSEPPLRNYNIPLPDFDNIDCLHDFHNGETVSSIDNNIVFDDSRSGSSRSYKGSQRRNKIFSNKNTLPDMVNEAIALEHCSKSDNLSSSDEEKLNHIPDNIDNQSIFTRNKSESPNGNDYETDSLERASKEKRKLSPIDYSDVPSSQASPSLSNALPLEEELTMRNAVYKIHSSSNSNTPSPQRDICIDSKHFETVDKKRTEMYSPEIKNIIKEKSDYSFVSEVYVNNNFGSTPTSPSGSECSMGSRKLRSVDEECDEKPGCLTIEVKDPPENYIKIHESDGFEPDTLDRKHPKNRKFVDDIQFSRKDCTKIISSTESKPSQLIQLRSSGSFKKATSKEQFATKFNNLRNDQERPKLSPSMNQEVKTIEDSDDTWDDSEWNTDEGRILTLEYRHSKRQRQCTPPTIKQLKNLARPDILPPLPPTVDSPIYEKPIIPPKRVENDRNNVETLSKNGQNRSLRPNQVIPKAELDSRPNTNHDLHFGPSCSPLRASVQSQTLEYIDSSSANTVQSITQNTDISCRVSNRQMVVKNCSGGNIDSSTFVRVREDGHSRTRFRRKKGVNIEDSGYLSSDSTGSRQIQKKIVLANIVNCSDTDDTENEARSESGAESTEAHSVYFGSFRKVTSSDENSNNNKSSRSSLRNLKH